MFMHHAVVNTDRKLWQENPDDALSPSIHVTESGGIGINVGGMVIVRPVRDWHALAAAHATCPVPNFERDGESWKLTEAGREGLEELRARPAGVPE